MEFASKYVFRYSDSDEESVSDEEFEGGMSVSESDSSDDEADAEVPDHADAGSLPVGLHVLREATDASVYQDPAPPSIPHALPPPIPHALPPPIPHSLPPAPSGASVSTEKGKEKKGLKKFFSRLPSRGGGKEKKASTKSVPAAHHNRTPSHWKRNSYQPGQNRSEYRRHYRRADTNVVSIKFEKLTSPSHMHTGDPVYCVKCSGILSRISKLQEEDVDKVWLCEFCGERNLVDIMEEEIPSIDDVTFMLEPAAATTASGPTGMDESMVIFCVDISGSMCVTTEVPGKINLRGNHLENLQSWNTRREDQHLPGERRNVTYISRLQSMQAAVDHQLQELVKDYPHRKVALISFNNEVEVLGDGSQTPVCISGDKLKDKTTLTKTGSEIQTPKSVKESRVALGEKVFDLDEGGATALGPALTVAVAMASQCPGSKVIVCTDGMANVGLGSLENLNTQEEKESVDDFYTDLGESALSKSVSISVVSISGSDCKLAQLGRVAQITGGQVNIVDPLKLTQEFSTILANRVIATNVTATFLLHNALYIRQEADEQSKVVRVVGNVSADTEITFEYGIKKEARQKEASQQSAAGDQGSGVDEGKASGSSVDKQTSTLPKEYPFQLQIQYTDTEGAKALRVFTQSKPVTTERKTAEKDINLHVLGKHTAFTSAQLALEGEYTASRGMALMQQRLAWRHGQQDSDNRNLYHGYFNNIRSVENKVNMIQQSERSTRGTTYSDEEECNDEPLDHVDGSKKQAQKKKMKKVHRSHAVSDEVASDFYNMSRVAKNVSSKSTKK